MSVHGRLKFEFTENPSIDEYKINYTKQSMINKFKNSFYVIK